MYTLQTYLSPIPEIVIKNTFDMLSPLMWKNKKIIFAPHGELIVNLFYRGYFQGFDVIGALDRSPVKIGQSLYGLSIYGYDEISALDVDIIVIANTRYHEEIYRSLLNVVKDREIFLFDLCSGYEHRAFRRELAEKLDCRELAHLRPGCINLPVRLEKDVNMKVEVTLEAGWGLGDKLCALSAAREFARRNPNLEVYFNTLPRIVSAFNDELIHLGRGAYPLPENNALFHREKDSSPAGNYLGCYYLGLGLDFDMSPSLELPQVPPLPGLEPGKYIALQPTANWAQPNITGEQLQRIIESCSLPVVLSGAYVPINVTPKTSIEEQQSRHDSHYLDGADATYLGDEMAMLSIISHAALVISPRSASAHIAAGYGVRSIVWVPSDGENWHLDYPDWEHFRVQVDDPCLVSRIVNKVSDYLSLK